MIKQKFIGREKELEWLKREHGRERSLVVLYGRRRVGKTELIKQFSSKHSHIYFLAGEKPDEQNRKELQTKMAEFLNDSLFGKATFESWEELFEEFVKKTGKKPILIIDEFPYLISQNKAIPSIFQKIWDETMKNEKAMIVLLGSSIGMMETHVLGYKSPLYGRRTGQWKLQPLPFKSLKKAFPGISFEETVRFFGFIDGIPGYLRHTDCSKSSSWNIQKNIFTKGAFLYEEAEFLLRQELREPVNYFQILQAIAEGNRKYGKIVGRTSLDKSMVSQYLQNLIQLHIVKKEFPVTQRKESRNAHYGLSDNYFAFWFSFVYPNKSLVEEDKQELLLKTISERLKRHESFVFEGVCRQLLWELCPIQFNKIGRWWHKDKEIDIVALNEENKEILFGECKWKEKVNCNEIAKRLAEKTKHVKWNVGGRKEHLAIFAKTFKKRISEWEGMPVHCFDMKDLSEAMEK